MERSRLFRKILILLCFLATGFLYTGCWATWSELKKERHMREELSRQFQAFKRSQAKKERIFLMQRKKAFAEFASLVTKMRLQYKKTQDFVAKMQKQIQQGQSATAEMLTTTQQLQRRSQEFLGKIGQIEKQLSEIAKGNPEAAKQIAQLKKYNDELREQLKGLRDQVLPKNLFARAKSAYKERKYKQALSLFKLFTKRFGSDDLADNAYLYIGDIYRKQGQFNPAIIAYDELVKKFPRGSQAPIALFRLGMLHYKLGLCRRGRTYFRRVLIIRRRARSLASTARKFYRKYRSLCKRKRRRRRRARRRSRRSRRKRNSRRYRASN